MTRWSSAMSPTRTWMTPRGRWRWADTSAMDRISWQRAALARCSTVSLGVCPRPRWWRPASRSPGRRGWAECARRSSHTAELVAGPALADRRGWSWRCLTWLAGQAYPARLLAFCSCWRMTILDGLRGHAGCSRREGGLELGPQPEREDLTRTADQPALDKAGATLGQAGQPGGDGGELVGLGPVQTLRHRHREPVGRQPPARGPPLGCGWRSCRPASWSRWLR